MSDVPADDAARAEFDRIIEEARKFSAEAHKLTVEALKLAAEERKLNREYRLLPWSVLIGVATGFGLGMAQLLVHLAGWWR